MEPGATQPVMDQAIFARSIFNQLKGRWNGSNTPIPLGRTGLGRYRLRQAVDQVRGHAPEQWCARGRPAAILYARAITTYFDLQAGLRSDIDSRPTRNWAAFGIQGLAPYFFDLEPTGYVSGQGHLAAKLEASYDLLLTQRLILQPQIELVPFSVKPSDGIGILPDCYAFVADDDFGTRRTKRHKLNFLGSIVSALLDSLSARSLQPVTAMDSTPFWDAWYGAPRFNW